MFLRLMKDPLSDNNIQSRRLCVGKYPGVSDERGVVVRTKSLARLRYKRRIPLYTRNIPRFFRCAQCITNEEC